MRQKKILGFRADEFDFVKYIPNMLPPPAGKTYELPTNPGRKFEDPFDLTNLIFYDELDARNLLNELEVLCYHLIETGGTEKIVAVVGTGGTIAMVKDGDELIPRLDSEELLNMLPSSSRKKYQIASIQLPKMVDSSVMPPDVIADTVILMSAAWEKMSSELKAHFAGFLVTHGTDTMADSAALFRMMLGRNVPFNTAFVGAQKTVEDDLNDVSINLDGALACLGYAHNNLRNAENNEYAATHHFVFMNGSSGAAMNQVGITKVADTRIEAFISPMHKPLLSYSEFGANGIRSLPANQIRNNNGEFKPLIVRGYVNVETIKAEQGRNPELDKAHIKSVASSGDLTGMILVTFGSFTFHPANLKAIVESADASGIPIFVANPFATGSTDHNYGPAIAVRGSGAIPIHMMPAAARAKIHIGRAMFGNGSEAFLKFMCTDYVGEMPEDYEV